MIAPGRYRLTDLLRGQRGTEAAMGNSTPAGARVVALDPADVIGLVHDGREIELRLVSITDSDGRGIEAVRHGRAAYDLPPRAPPPSALSHDTHSAPFMIDPHKARFKTREIGGVGRRR